MKRFVLLYVAPVLLLLGVVVLPLALGQRTLFLRDVSNAHYQMKHAQALVMRAGHLPLVDPYRGYRPLLGNLNAVPLYPDNLLYLVASPRWALNAHFWLHLLLAPFAMAWLARAWGLGREAAWAAGTCYATSGFFLSQLNLYNLIAGAALIPAFAAALIRAWPAADGRRTTWRLAAPALTWTLLLLAGDPLSAALGLALGVSAAAARHGWRPPAAGSLAAALACGTVVAAPQLVATWQILPASYRGFWGYSAASVLAQSWDPRTALEWLVPFVYGRPNLAFWGQEFYGGNEPLYLTLYPGLLALVLVITAGRPRHDAGLWAWGAVAVGLFLALGGFNPLVRALAAAPGGGLLRYPIKVWPLVAVGASLLCGLGWQRFILDDDGRRRLFRVAGALALLYGAGLVLLTHPPAALVARWRAHLPPPMLAEEPVRWAALCLLDLVLAILVLALAWTARRRAGAAPALLALHAASQLFLLQPARATDDVAPYRTPPAQLLEVVPPEALVVHGRVGDLFGPERASPRPYFPDADARWAERLRFAELFPQAGVTWGRRYDFDRSPEGLDPFLSIAVGQAIKTMSDHQRLRVLAASGVDTLILDRPLDEDARSKASLRLRRPSVGRDLWVYHLFDAAPPIALASQVRTVADERQALSRVLEPDFDPSRMVVLPGGGPDRRPAPGELTVLASGPDGVVAEVSSPEGAVLVVQRAYLPIYRATIDRRPAPVLPANAHRLAVEIPPGHHRVHLAADRRPFHAACLAAALAFGALLVLAVKGTRTDATVARQPVL